MQYILGPSRESTLHGSMILSDWPVASIARKTVAYNPGINQYDVY